MPAKLTSNGFGRWQQTIVFHVPKRHCELVSARLGITPLEVSDTPDRISFRWSRWTVRPGNDEDVVWDLALQLQDGPNELDRKIDWEASSY
jgi:hypothetical protein